MEGDAVVEMIPDLHITLSVPPDVVRQLGKMNECADRARRACKVGQLRRAKGHLHQALRIWHKVSPKINVIPAEAFTRPLPPHTEPNYE